MKTLVWLLLGLGLPALAVWALYTYGSSAISSLTSTTKTEIAKAENPGGSAGDGYRGGTTKTPGGDKKTPGGDKKHKKPNKGGSSSTSTDHANAWDVVEAIVAPWISIGKNAGA